jgi:hypothetical protein
VRQTAPGDIRKTVSAAAAFAVVALTASCTGGSSAAGTHPTASTPASAATSSASADTLAHDSLVSLPATALIRVGESSSAVTLQTSKSQPLQLQVSPSGAISLTLAMRGAAGDAFSVEGPAGTGGDVADDHVVIFLSSGDLIDTEQGNPCTATYDVLTQQHVDATYQCLTRDGAAKVVVTVHLTAGA